MVEVAWIHPEDWKGLSRVAHLAVFGSALEEDQERLSFVMLGKKKGTQELLGWITCLEHDRDTLYWKFGGTLRGARETSVSWLLYQAAVESCKGKYKRITTRIENDNLVMLKMAMKVGFRVIGVTVYKGQIYLEHVLEF